MLCLTWEIRQIGHSSLALDPPAGEGAEHMIPQVHNTTHYTFEDGHVG
jgi:hypothetical protein